jgi:hypothetical protein
MDIKYKDPVLESTSRYNPSTSSNYDAISKDINELSEITHTQKLATALQKVFRQQKNSSDKCLYLNDRGLFTQTAGRALTTNVSSLRTVTGLC